MQTATETAPITDRAPDCMHVHVLPSGTRCPVRNIDAWHRYAALYGKGYPWLPATADEIADVEAQDAYFAEHGHYPA